MIDFGGAIVPPLGGAVQHLDRLGTRFALDLTFPTMRTEPDGRICATDLCRAKLEGAIAPFAQDGLDIGNPGNPVVNGGGQFGSSIALRGFTSNYTMRYGQALSLVVGGRRYIEFAAATTQASEAGFMLLPVFPMLRASPPDGALAEVAEPKIEGSLSGNEVSWTRLTSPHCQLGTITITEDE